MCIVYLSLGIKKQGTHGSLTQELEWNGVPLKEYD